MSPSELSPITIGTNSDWSTQTALSPFRYPGGKGFLSQYLADRIKHLRLPSPVTFCEPFCGGAGAAVNLLAAGVVESLFLNDADIRIHSAWRAMIEESERFIAQINDVPLTMDEWYAQQQVINSSPPEYSFELGFATFFMNRTTRSGIVEKAGPIGGFTQTGKWKIDARFNRSRLAKQINWLASNAERIHLSNLDALNFLSRTRRVLDVSSTMFFIDPPYVKAGGRLYLNGMTEAKHIALADILVSGVIPHWVLTYDDAPLIREIYRSAKVGEISVNYSLQQKRKEQEILVLPI